MLGELVIEAKGKTTGKRVLSPEGPKVEISFASQGTYRGTQIKEIGTFWAIPRPGGVLYGEGQGAIMTNDGEMGSWSGSGIGKFKEGGTISYRGSVIYQTASQGKLGSLNNSVIVFEYDVDADDNSIEKGWEWK
jgi:hypothetical protein